MTYFGFLARFVVLPLAILRALIWWDRQQNTLPPDELTNWPADKTLLAHAVVAVAYTTLWDNYLVASKIWGYDRKLVSGLKIGWVPIEEYTFFILQPLMTGSLLQFLAPRLKPDEPGDSRPRARGIATVSLGVVWAASLYGLARGGPRLRYLSLILGWALPPIMLQTAFGGDILWRHRKLIAASLIPSTLYLGLADSKAITVGTWNISPKKTTGIHVIPNLPLEEALFFLVTNVLLVFGVTLVLSKESENRLPESLRGRYEQFKARFITR